MKTSPHWWHVAAAILTVLFLSSCALLPSLPLGKFTFSTGPIGIEHLNVGVRGIFGSSKLNRVVLHSVRAGSAASEAGIVSGDELLSIDGVKIRTLSFTQFKALLATFEQTFVAKEIAFEVISPGAATSRVAVVVVPATSPNRPRDLAALRIRRIEHDLSYGKNWIR